MKITFRIFEIKQDKLITTLEDWGQEFNREDEAIVFINRKFLDGNIGQVIIQKVITL